MLIKAKFQKNGKSYGRSYTYRTEDEVKPGDIVTDAKGSKLVVMDEPVDEEWVKAYGESRIAVVKKYVEQESEG